MRKVLIRSFEPEKPQSAFPHPSRVRETVCWIDHEGRLQEIGREGWWRFENGFCSNYLGRGGIAWIIDENYQGDSHRKDIVFPCPDALDPTYR